MGDVIVTQAANDDERYTLADIETRLADLMQYAPRGGLSISDWVAARMRSAADKADARLAATPVQNRGEHSTPVQTDGGGSHETVDALKVSDFQRGYEACREDAAAIADKWRDENKAAAAKARTSERKRDAMGLEHPGMSDMLDGAAIECNAIAGEIRNMEARNG